MCKYMDQDTFKNLNFAHYIFLQDIFQVALYSTLLHSRQHSTPLYSLEICVQVTRTERIFLYMVQIRFVSMLPGIENWSVIFPPQITQPMYTVYCQQPYLQDLSRAPSFVSHDSLSLALIFMGCLKPLTPFCGSDFGFQPSLSSGAIRDILLLVAWEGSPGGCLDTAFWLYT